MTKWLLTLAVGAACAAGAAPAPKLPEALTPRDYPTVRVYRDFAYGPRGDLPEEGPGCTNPVAKRPGYLAGTPASQHRSGQSFDVYLPRPKAQLKGNEPVMIYVHGGAWHDVWDKDAGQEFYSFLAGRAGYVVVSMNYHILPEDLAKTRPFTEIPFVTMLKDIDLLNTHLATFLPEAFGVKPRKVAIGGESAGGHLSSLYAYDEANPGVLKLGLKHRLPVAFELNIVGATDLTEPRFAPTFLPFVPIETVKAFSPVHMITPKSAPTLLCYSSTSPGAADDGIIPVSTFTRSTNFLAKAGVPYAAHFEPQAPHAAVLTPAFPKAREWYVKMLKAWAPKTR